LSAEIECSRVGTNCSSILGVVWLENVGILHISIRPLSVPIPKMANDLKAPGILEVRILSAKATAVTGSDFFPDFDEGSKL
jgi:hypothetical protein